MKYYIHKNHRPIYAYFSKTYNWYEYHMSSWPSGYDIEIKEFSLLEARFYLKDLRVKIKTNKSYAKAWGKHTFNIVPII